MAKNIIYIFQILIGVSLVLLIILQAKGSGLGSTFGGSGAVYSTKRGAEKIIFYLTIFLSFLFFVVSLYGAFS